MFSLEEYVLFERMFENRTIKIYVPKDIFQKYRVAICNVFKKFQRTYIKSEQLQKGMYICDNYDIQIPMESELYIYDITNGDWIFGLLTDVETYVINELKITVFHGAAVCRNDHIVLIIGKRKSGKSTLTHFLIESGWKLIDDDCIYFDRDSVLGLGFPLRLRKVIFDSERIFTTCVDMDGERRYLLSASSYKLCAKAKNITIIFPTYMPGMTFFKEEISKMQLFTVLLQNIRYSVDEKSSVNDVVQLMRIANGGYSVAYSRCADVNSFLRSC